MPFFATFCTHANYSVSAFFYRPCRKTVFKMCSCMIHLQKVAVDIPYSVSNLWTRIFSLCCTQSVMKTRNQTHWLTVLDFWPWIGFFSILSMKYSILEGANMRNVSTGANMGRPNVVTKCPGYEVDRTCIVKS